jgi:hypothetical protein
MRYWGYLAAKLMGASALMFVAARAILRLLPQTTLVRNVELDAFGSDLRYTVWAWLLAVTACLGLWAIIIEHRYRCRTCLRRLRMPLVTGSWTHIVMGGPQTEYICPYGHGTLKVDELQLTGHSEPDWQPHDDMWKELTKK